MAGALAIILLLMDLWGFARKLWDGPRFILSGSGSHFGKLRHRVRFEAVLSADGFKEFERLPEDAGRIQQIRVYDEAGMLAGVGKSSLLFFIIRKNPVQFSARGGIFK